MGAVVNKTIMPDCSIEGVLLTPLKQLNDARGAVLHMLRNDAADFTHFGECYFSEIVPGAVKAWKRHRLQTQNLAVPVGRIRLVIYDSRENSASKGKLAVLELGRPDSYYRISIPPNLWYGFACLGDVTALIVNCSDIAHSPDESDVQSLTYSAIPYRWELTEGVPV